MVKGTGLTDKDRANSLKIGQEIEDMYNQVIKDIEKSMNSLFLPRYMDVQFIYSINSTSVGEMNTENSKAFNAINDDGGIFLMYNNMIDVSRSAIYKAAAKYPALETVRKRDEIEAEISRQIAETLKERKLDTSLTITQVQVRNVQPAQSNSCLIPTNEHERTTTK